MDTQTFIAYFLGAILIILGTSLVINKKFFKQVIKDIEKNPLGLYISGIMGFFLGLFIVVNSQGFITPEDSIISLLGYIMTLKSIAVLILPDVMIGISKKMKKTFNYFRYAGILYIILGLYLIISKY